MGLGFIVPKDERLPQLNAVSIPEGIDDAAVRGRLLKDYNLEIGAGLGPLSGKIWRIGLMGFASNSKNVMLCITALGSVLHDMGYKASLDDALDAAYSILKM